MVEVNYVQLEGIALAQHYLTCYTGPFLGSTRSAKFLGAIDTGANITCLPRALVGETKKDKPVLIRTCGGRTQRMWTYYATVALKRYDDRYEE